jgi:aspartate carbamoyltransferase catalytic subunit
VVEVTQSSNPVPEGAGIFFAPAPESGAEAPRVEPTLPSGAPGVEPTSTRRHLLGLNALPAPAILALLDSAREWRVRWSRSREPHSVLSGVEVCNAFFEDSTRTRLSFELAERRLGATPLSFGVAGSSSSKGETLLDTLRTIVAMGVDVVVIRHRASGAAAFVARELDVTVVNAGDGAHEHPTQGLLDLLTLSDAWGGVFEGRRLAILGDVAHSRVARSAIFGLTTLGGRVTVAGPATLMPADVETLGCELASSAEEALRDADAAIALRLQVERMDQGLLPSLGEYSRQWGLDRARVGLMKPHAPVLHPGPMNREVEIASDVADGDRSRVLCQVANGVAVRAAVLEWCAARKSS